MNKCQLQGELIQFGVANIGGKHLKSSESAACFPALLFLLELNNPNYWGTQHILESSTHLDYVVQIICPCKHGWYTTAYMYRVREYVGVHEWSAIRWLGNSKSLLCSPPNHIVRQRHPRVLITGNGLPSGVIKGCWKMNRLQGGPPVDSVQLVQITTQ